MKRIPLTRGQSTVVSDDDYPGLSRHCWHLRTTNHKKYAIRREYFPTPRWVRMHREILKATDELEVDHINGDGLDNRRENLRLCSHRENCRASKTKTPGTSSRFRGVTWHRIGKRWMAQLKKNGKRIYLGLFLAEEAAARCYDAAAIEHFGKFASLNFPK